MCPSPDKVLKDLRNSQFNIKTENILANHPFVRDAEDGKLSINQLKRFVCEQFYIQKCDLKSLEMMAEKCKENNQKSCFDFFKMLCDGERYAADLIVTMAKWLNLSDKDLLEYQCSMKAQAYPSFLARCVLYETPAFVAVACAVNFPAWGRMCGRLLNAILNSKGSFGTVSQSDLEFLNCFATPIEGFDQMALNCVKGEFGEHFKETSLFSVVRLLQEAEILFWDSIYGK